MEGKFRKFTPKLKGIGKKDKKIWRERALEISKSTTGIPEIRTEKRGRNQGLIQVNFLESKDTNSKN